MLGLFRNSRADDAVRRAYAAIVRQARRPEFYTRWGIADSPEGRFDMLALHAYLVLNRLKADGPESQEFAQALFDLMFVDVDHNLRELGVGDLSVGKHVKALAQAFYGRIAAYDRGLAETGRDLAQALGRSLFEGTPPPEGALEAFQAYVRREAARLAAADSTALLRGEVTFGPPPGAASLTGSCS